MSRYGNPYEPTHLDAPDVVHAWAVIAPGFPGMALFGLLEEHLEQQAQADGRVLVSAPTYETFRLTDPGVPPEVLEGLPGPVPAGVPLAAVHGYAVAAARNVEPARATAAMSGSS